MQSKMSTLQPDHLHAWILGSGIASLTAAVHLIQEAHMPPPQIHIIEKNLSVAGSVTASLGDAENGYDYRGGVLPQFNDTCIDALLSLVPSTSNPNQTVREEIIQHAQSLDRKTGLNPAQTRYLTSEKRGVVRMDAKGAMLTLKDRINLFMLASKREKSLGRSCIHDFFGEGFFCSGYWLLFATTYVPKSKLLIYTNTLRSSASALNLPTAPPNSVDISIVSKTCIALTYLTVANTMPTNPLSFPSSASSSRKVSTSASRPQSATSCLPTTTSAAPRSPPACLLSKPPRPANALYPSPRATRKPSNSSQMTLSLSR